MVVHIPLISFWIHMDCKEGHLLLHNHASTALTEERKEEKSIKKWNMHMILNLMQLLYIDLDGAAMGRHNIP